MKAILLVRVSTYQQDPEGQLQKLIEYANRQGYIEHKIVSTVESGLADSKDKIGTSEVFRIIDKDPDFNTVICSEISRLSRKEIILLELVEQFEKRKIQLLVYRPEIRLLDNEGRVIPQSKLTITIFGFFADEEVKQFKERTHTGLKNALRVGKSIPGKVLFGYDRVKKNDEKGEKSIFIINVDNAELVKNIFNWYLHGLPNSKDASAKKIAQYCISNGLHKYCTSKRNVLKLLKEKAYTGGKYFTFKERNNEQVFVKYDEIISNDIFDKVQGALRNARVEKQSKIKSKLVTLLARKIKCPQCNTYLTANYRKSKKGYNSSSYRCGRRSMAVPCPSKVNLGLRMLDSAIWSLMKSNNGFVKGINIESVEKKISEFKLNIKYYDEMINKTEEVITLLKSQSKELRLEFINGDISSDEYKENENIIANSISKLKEEIKPKQKEQENIKELLLQEESIFHSYNAETQSFRTQNGTVLVIDQIEKDKGWVKQYIDYFIQEIGILVHSKKLTVAEVVFKEPFFESQQHPEEFNNYFEKDLKYPVILIIDKHDTNRLNLYWGKKLKSTLVQDDSITTKNILTAEVRKFNLEDFISNDSHVQAEIIKYFTKINYTALTFS